jgi:hypothetical protein
MRPTGFVAAVVLILAASTGTRAAPLPASAKTLGVIALLPSTGHLVQVALLRFNYECKPFDLKGANLEAAAFNAASRALSPRYKVVRLTAPPGAALHTKNTEVMGAFKSFPTIAAQIRAFARPPQSVDAYLLVWGQARDSECRDAPLPYGFGLTRSVGGIKTNVSAFAQMILIDAHTDQELGTVWTRDAIAPLSGFDWKGRPAEASPEQAQQITTAMQTAFAGGVSKGVGSLLSGPSGEALPDRQ